MLVAVSCIYTLHSADKDSQSTAKYRRFLENVALQASLGSRTGSWLLSLAVPWKMMHAILLACFAEVLEI